MINFRTVKVNDEDFFKLYDQAYSWDKNKLCFLTKESPEFLNFFSSYFALYEDNNFIGYGIFNYDIQAGHNIRFLINDTKQTTVSDLPKKPRKINLAYIINPDYRKQGYGTRLFEYLVKMAEEKEDYDIIEVKILKKNIPSLSLIEKYDFDFKYFDDKTIVFQKTIEKSM